MSISVPDILPLLRKVRSLRFEARSEAGTGWDGVGSGSVNVVQPAANVVVFEESGTWQSNRGEVHFNNVFRWTAIDDVLRLEHLRFGPGQPVYLFDLGPDANGTWREVTPHQCDKDCYTASITVEDGQLVVAWSIRGPHKAESIRYTYS